VQAHFNHEENSKPKQILVSTLIGSEFLDKRKNIPVPSTANVRYLKKLIRAKYPGSPPISLQRLVSGSEVLSDETLIANVGPSVLLETLSGTGSYNRSLNVLKTIDAYLATIVQSSFIGSKLHSLQTTFLRAPDSSNENQGSDLETHHLRDMLNSLRSDFSETYFKDIADAKLREKSPELYSSFSWRERRKPVLSPLMKSLARELDLNKSAAINLLYFSALMMIFGLFGTASKGAAPIVLSLIPSLWMSKIRQVRVLLKCISYFLMQLIAEADFLLPLFPATFQEITKHVSK
jgi:hypothetical protein